MNRPIVQSVNFRESAEELFDAYLDPAKHAARCGKGPVVVLPEAGADFRAFDGGLRGSNVAIVPKRLIVQSWRASTDMWPESEPDSLLILAFSAQPGGGRIDLVHWNVPEAAFDLISNGWQLYYWKPWGGTLIEG